VAEELSAGAPRRWRAGGVLAQFLPLAAERARPAHLGEDFAHAAALAEDDAWNEASALVASVEDLELIDPALSSERLVYRLFHAHGVRVFRHRPLRAECSCSRAGVATMLRSFSQDDRAHMVENGVISVTCEFCSATYVFAPQELANGPSA